MNLNEWWTEIQTREAEILRGSSSWQAVTDSLLACVFCRRPLESAFADSRREKRPCNVAMLAWWKAEDATEASPVLAAGLYCHGRDRCLGRAEDIGHLLDVHAESALGKLAMPSLERIVFDYPHWNADALRRFVLVITELSCFQSKPSEARDTLLGSVRPGRRASAS